MSIATAITILTLTPLLADGHTAGDASAGEKAFRACQACHLVVNEDGEILAGKNAKTGPNLFGAVGAPAGAVPGFGYSLALKSAGQAGLVWDAESFAAYTQDPTGFLRTYLGNDTARSKMTYKVRTTDDAANLYAFLESLSQ